MPPNVSEDWHLKRLVIGVFGLLFADGELRGSEELQTSLMGNFRAAACGERNDANAVAGLRAPRLRPARL